MDEVIYSLSCVFPWSLNYCYSLLLLLYSLNINFLPRAIQKSWPRRLACAMRAPCVRHACAMRSLAIVITIIRSFGPGGLRAPCVLACAMRSLAIVITIVQSFFLSFSLFPPSSAFDPLGGISRVSHHQHKHSNHFQNTQEADIWYTPLYSANSSLFQSHYRTWRTQAAWAKIYAK